MIEEMPEFLRKWLARLPTPQNEALWDWLDDTNAPEEAMLNVLGEAWMAANGADRPRPRVTEKLAATSRSKRK